MIRLAKEDDVVAIRECAAEAYEKYVSRIGRKPAPMVADFEDLVGRQRVYLSAGDDDSLEGFVIFYQCGEYMHLENVAVANAHRGKGVGRHLIAYCEASAMDEGLSAVELYTNERMTENLTLYPHLGYAEVDRKTEDGFNRVYFRKDLR